MASLYEINKEILECVDTESGEIIDEEKLENLELEKNDKLENIALWIKNLKAEAEMIKAEKKNLDARIKSCENKADRLTELLKKELGGDKFKTAKVDISYRKSERVEITDLSVIPVEFLTVTTSADKTEIKKLLKSGVEVKGAELVENNNMQIK